MRLNIDATKCQGYGACVDLCPSVLDMDDWGYVSTIGDGIVPPGEEKAARKAARLCPEEAVQLTE